MSDLAKLIQGEQQPKVEPQQIDIEVEEPKEVTSPIKTEEINKDPNKFDADVTNLYDWFEIHHKIFEPDVKRIQVNVQDVDIREKLLFSVFVIHFFQIISN